MAVVLDTGALIAVERGHSWVTTFVLEAQVDGVPVRVSAAVVAQAWRGGARQARLALLLRGVEERSLDPATARRIGALLAVSGTGDVVDAAVVDLAADGDEILTSDPVDIAQLVAVGAKRVSVVPV